MQGHDEVLNDGRWLCDEGPYREYVAAWCRLNPNLGAPDPKNRWSPLRNGNARLAMIELGPDKQARRTDFLSATELSAHFRQLESRPPYLIREKNSYGHRRIYILEGLAPDFIAALGEHFLMDPTFFMRQERTTLWGFPSEGSRQTASLPSLVKPEKSFFMKYYELRRFEGIRAYTTFCGKTGRNVGVTRNTRPDLQGFKYEPVGIVHRKCSFWSRRCDSEGWDGE